MFSKIISQFVHLLGSFYRHGAGIGRKYQGLYICQNTSTQSIGVNRCAGNVQLLSDSSVLQHKRMGHTPIDVIKKYVALSHLKYEDHMCTVCPFLS